MQMSKTVGVALLALALALLPGCKDREAEAAAQASARAAADEQAAAEAERAGLASRVVPHDQLLDEVRKIAARMAEQSPLALMANKEMVNAALETTLTQGVQFERRLFHSLFAFEDQKEGMGAFVEKRKPEFRGR